MTKEEKQQIIDLKNLEIFGEFIQYVGSRLDLQEETISFEFVKEISVSPEAVGLCSMMNDDAFAIEIKREFNKLSMMMSIAHEMTHVAQFMTRKYKVDTKFFGGMQSELQADYTAQILVMGFLHRSNLKFPYNLIVNHQKRKNNYNLMNIGI